MKVFIAILTALFGAELMTDAMSRTRLVCLMVCYCIGIVALIIIHIF